MKEKDSDQSSLSTPTLNPKSPIDRFKGQSKLAKWINKNFVTKMDHYTNIRSTLVLLLLVYLLGKNLNWFLRFLVFVHCYLISYRFIRFWIQRYLMFMIDLCYPGNFLMIYFILFDDMNRDLFLLIYPLTSGVMSLAVVVCDNQADLSNTDFLTSCFIHSLPVTTMWAIRWKNYLYPQHVLDQRVMLDIGVVSFGFDETFFKLLLYPYVLWILWAVVYFFLNTWMLRKYAYSDYYDSAICDFYKSDMFQCMFGDHKKNTVIKYLLQHLIYMTIVTPLALMNFYSFYFNSAYLLCLLVFLGFNKARKNQALVNELLKKAPVAEGNEKNVYI